MPFSFSVDCSRRRSILLALAALPVSALASSLVDAGHAKVREASAQLTQGLVSERERAVAIHDFVRDQVLFGFTGAFYAMRASDVLEARLGYCNTKATLFIALLRAAGLEARQQFVDIDVAVLSGLIDPATPFVDHSYTEVRVEGQWIATDSYIVDRTLMSAAQRRLRREGRRLGYGVHVDGRSDWDGLTPSFAQYVMSDPRIGSRRWGVFDDVESFYASTSDAWNRRSLALRLIFPFAARRANAAADALRGEFR